MIFRRKSGQTPGGFDAQQDRERFEELFLILSGQPYSLRRRDLLRHALDLLPEGPVAALLWLWDPDWHLLALNDYASNVLDDDTPEALIGMLARPVDPITTKCLPDPAAFNLSKDAQPRLLQWAKKYGFADYEALVPVQGQIGSEHQTIAFLQLLSSREIDSEAVARAEVLCGGIAVLLSRSRDDRRLNAVDRMLKDQAERSVADWLDVAAQTLLEITNGTAAIMFRETPDGFKAVATKGTHTISSPLIASEESVVNRVAERQKAVRLPDFNDNQARIEAFGSDVHDRNLHRIMQNELLQDDVRSVLLTPVVFQKHTLAVIAVINKSPKVHLARVFSKTDEEVLNTIAGFLAGILPSIEMYAAVGKMANVVSTETLDDPAQLQQVFMLLTEMIPGTTGVGLIRRRRGDTAARVNLVGGSLWTEDTALLLRRPDEVLPAGSTRHYYVTQRIPTITHPFWLTVELARSELTGYERQFLTFVCKELSHVIVTEQGREEVVARFAQLRHAIRSGLTGVSGYVHEALGCFDLYRSLDYAPSVLSQSRFRKALQRANFAATKTQHLLEESRFLLGNITHEGLRLGTHSVSAVVRTVLDTVRPYADERELSLRVNNQLRGRTDPAVFDRTLIEMLLFNIVDNAIKYSYRGKPIDISIDVVRDSWRFRVTDFGVRILPEDREAIFLPFTRRLTGEGAEKRPGTGLGLAVGRDIARAHRGDIGCESIPLSNGLAETTFVVTIPRFQTERS